MGPLLVVGLLLFGSAVAGPVARDVGSCGAEDCLADSKFQYSEGTTYIYSYEASNSIRMEESSELSSILKATIEITRISRCEMALQVTDANVRHESSVESSSPDIEKLKKHVLRFSWSDGKISHICPHPDDTNNINNMKKGILSALQNTMKTLDHDTIVRETDVLSSCDTEYKVKSFGPKISLHKKKDLSTCSDHIKGRTGYTFTPYESLSSPIQHLPLMKDKEYSCDNVIEDGITKEVFCVEKVHYKPLSTYTYFASGRGETKLSLVSTKPSKLDLGRTLGKKESLVYVYEPSIHENLDSEAVASLQELCSKADGLLDKDVGSIVHKLVHIFRGLSASSVQRIYESLKSGSLCKSPKVLGIFLDTLKAASSSGAIELLAKLAKDGDLSQAEALLWFISMPFSSHAEEDAVQAAVPLLKKEYGNKQALLSVPAFAYKFCHYHPDCESSSSVQNIIAELQQRLGDDCHATTTEEEEEIIGALKGYGNLGHFIGSKDPVLKCASTSTNSMPLRIAALESFRRTPCSEELSSKLLEFYENQQDEDEFRIAALIALSKCPSPQIIYRLGKSLPTEINKQVEVFTWSYLMNLRSTSDPLKQKAKRIASQLKLATPASVDITKFSRNFEHSHFYPQLNLGYSFEGNLIHSHESFIPRTGSADLTVDVFGKQLNLLEVGLRIENLDHELESIFGPRGWLKKYHSTPVATHANAVGSNSEAFNARIQSLKDKVGLKPKDSPKGSYYIRILGNEMRWRNVDDETFHFLHNIKIDDIIAELSKHSHVDNGNSLLFIDNALLLPSITGRAYKLAVNASATMGFQADRKLNVREFDFSNLLLNLDARYKPSATVQMDASISIHGESYEPTFKVATTLNAGHDVAVKVDLDEGPSINVKLDYPAEENSLLSFKRTFFEYGKDGEKSLKNPNFHHIHYCTKHINRLLGLEFCGDLNIPHMRNEEGRSTIPFLGPMDVSIHMKKTDPDMKGFEFKLHMPHEASDTRKFKLLFDTPNSRVERKFLTEVVISKESDKSTRSAIKFHSPFYELEVDATCSTKDDKLHVKIDAIGNGKRHYSLNLDMEKDIKGARLAEYKPTLTVALPNRTPVTFTGTIVFSKGRKHLLSFTISSDKVFNHPFSIKGSVGREGSFGQLDSKYQLTSDVVLTALSRTSKLHGTYNRQGLDVDLDVSLDCSTDNTNPKSLKLKSVLKDVSITNSLSFVAETEMLTSEYPQYNFRSTWDFGFKHYHHLKNNVTIHYGEDFEDKENVINFIQINEFDGDFYKYSQLNIDNRLGITIPRLKIEKSIFATAVWDIQEKPKVHVNIGFQTEKDSYVKLEMNIQSYNSLNERPMKVITSTQVIIYSYEFSYRTEVQETSTGIIQGRDVIQTHPGYQIVIDYIYSIRSTEQVIYHELECTFTAPNLVAPVQHKSYFKSSSDIIEFVSNTNSGNRPPFIFAVKLNNNGPGEISVDIPFVVGKLKIDNKVSETLLEADFVTTGRQPQKITGNGRIYHKDNKQVIDATINYAGFIDVVVNGGINDNLLYGPHELQAVFSGSIDPMSVIAEYKIEDDKLKAFAKYLRNDAEKLSVDLHGKYIDIADHFEFESGILLTSPFKVFDGKEIYCHFLHHNSATHYNVETQYRLKAGPYTGYSAKSIYNRKKGWPGHIKSSVTATRNQKIVFERSTAIVYGGGKYSFKTSLIPYPGRRMNFESSVEVSTMYAAVHQSLTTTLQNLQQIRLNAVADLRNIEDYKLQSNIDVNSYNVYDFNATMSMKSVTDFDLKMKLFGNLTPSLHIYSKAQSANSLTKYSLSIDKDSTEILSGKGEIKKRKKGFNGDVAFNYKGKDFLTININNEVKSPKERNYVLKFKSFYRTYTISINSLKDVKTVKTTVNLCRNENENCATMLSTHKEEEDHKEWYITYKRDEIELNFDRIYADTPDALRRSLVIHSGGKRYGYDIRYGKDEKSQNILLGIILPSHEMQVGTQFAFAPENSALTLEFATDTVNHPDRKLVLDFKVDNQVNTHLPSKFDLKIAHPILEKPIELSVTADYSINRAKFLEIETSLDYSSNPEDKIISKSYIEKTAPQAITIKTYVYHQVLDDEHLDFTTKINASRNDAKKDLGLECTWKDENNRAQNAYILIHRDYQEEKFNLVYHRPRLDFRVDASSTPSTALHDDLSKMDIIIQYNGETTHAQFIHDYSGHCYYVHILGKGDEIARKIEMCADLSSPVIFSVKTTSKEENQMVFDYSLEVIRPSFRSIDVRQHWNPDFFGTVTFQLTRLSDELLDAGFGTIPIAASPRYKNMKVTFAKKVLDPIRDFTRNELNKLREGLKSDIINLRNELHQYYKSLPANPVVVMTKRLLKVLKPSIDEILEDYWERVEEMKVQIQHELQAFYTGLKEQRQLLKERCDNIPECRLMKQAIIEKEWKAVTEAIRSLIQRLPENVQRYVEKGGKIEVAFQKAHKIAMMYVKPLLEYEVVKDALKTLEHYRADLRERLDKLLKYYLITIKKEMSDFIHTNEKYITAASAKFKEILNDIQRQDFESLQQTFKKLLEEILSSVPLPSLHSLFKAYADTERGILNLEIYFPLDLSHLEDIIDTISSSIASFSDAPENFNWNKVIVKVKRIADLQIVPPYREQAVILGSEHYITFDKTFYDFDGECAYLLASDLQDGNFSLVLTPTFSLESDKATGERTHAFGFFAGDTSVLINLKDKSVKAGENEVDLPYITNSLSVTRHGNTILLDDHHGVKVRCHVVYELCVATISGWYYGKTAGLFGTYDYEPANDFKRPKGQIPNSVTTFAKSWDISKGCKTKNLAPEVKINKDDNIYHICEDYFAASRSPLSSCFKEVNPEKYMQLCYRHVIPHKTGDTALINKKMCDVAAAYVLECERNYIELNLPPKCIACEAPDGSVMKHGEKKKYENFERKSSEIVFIIEAHTCNDRLIKDIGSLTRAIDKELTNEGYRNNLYGIVDFGSFHEPMVYSTHGKVFYQITDIPQVVSRIHLTNRTSTSALEAIRLALNYPFSSSTSKSLVLLSCSPCNYDYKSLQYPVIQQILLEHEIVLHVINNQEIKLRKSSSKERSIIGTDADTVYFSRHVAQRDLVGEPSLRSQILLPKDACVALAQDVSGSFFSTLSLSQETKAWRSLLARRLLKTSHISPCRWCDCTTTADHVAQAVCRPCQTKRPKLPFSVCKSCAAVPGVFTSVYSYVLHHIL